MIVGPRRCASYVTCRYDAGKVEGLVGVSEKWYL